MHRRTRVLAIGALVGAVIGAGVVGGAGCARPPAAEPAAVAEPASGPTPRSAPGDARLPVAAMVFTHPPDQSGDAYAVRADGTVTAGGKAVGSVRGHQLLNAQGGVLLEVAADGTVTGRGVPAGLHFEGDVLVRGDGTRIAVGSDGVVTAAGPGQSLSDARSLGAFDHADRAPRLAILVALLIGTPQAGAATDDEVPPPPEDGGPTGGVVGGTMPRVMGGTDEPDPMGDDDDIGGVAGGSADVEGLPPPPPPPTPRMVPAAELEALRIKGNRTIAPDAPTLAAMRRAGATRVGASVRVCVDGAGQARSAVVVASSGFPGYDATVAREARTWRYRPFMVDRKRTEVCSRVKVRYSLT